MTESLGTAVLELGADSSRLDRTLTGVERSTGQRMTALGGALTKTLTPVAGAIGLAGKKAFDEWHDGMSAIRAGTGATGADLEALGDSMANVGAKVTAPLSEVGQVLADLNTRVGLTGKPLEELAKRFLDLRRLNMPADVAAVTRLFGDWSIATEDQSATMDALFRTSQATGIRIDDLARSMVQFGSPMRQLGFDFETAAAMFAKFEKEGVAVETLMPGLRFGLKNLSGATPKVTEALKDLGVSLDDPQEALADVFKLIKDAPNDMAANQLAFTVFGQRAGPDMAAAIREGRFELDELIQTTKTGSDTIEKAAADTLTLGDRMTMFKNRVFAATGPYGELIGLIGGGLAAIGPTILAIGFMTQAFKGLNLAMLANPWVLITLGIIALGVALVVAWKKSETFRNIVIGAFEKIRAVANAVIGFIRDHWKAVVTKLPGVFVITKIIDNFNRIRDVGRAVFGAVRDAIQWVIDKILSLIGWLNAVIDKIGWVTSHIPHGTSTPATFGGKGGPGAAAQRAHGGPVTAGRSFLVGEVGPELFVPNVSGRIIPNAALASSGGGTVVFNFPRYGGNRRELIADMKRGLADYRRQNGGADPW